MKLMKGCLYGLGLAAVAWIAKQAFTPKKEHDYEWENDALLDDNLEAHQKEVEDYEVSHYDPDED